MSDELRNILLSFAKQTIEPSPDTAGGFNFEVVGYGDTAYDGPLFFETVEEANAGIEARVDKFLSTIEPSDHRKAARAVADAFNAVRMYLEKYRDKESMAMKLMLDIANNSLKELTR